MRFGVLSSLLALLLLASHAGAAQTAGGSTDPDLQVGPAPGDIAPDFTLADANGNSYSLRDYTGAGNVVVLEWFNPQCPAVQKYRADSTFMKDTEDAFTGDPVVWLAIDSSGPGRQGSDPRGINRFVRDHGMTAPVLMDSAGDVGRDYGVMVTPTVFVIAPDGTVLYSGAPDSSSAIDRWPQGENYVKSAVLAGLDNAVPLISATRPHGCTVPYANAETY